MGLTMFIEVLPLDSVLRLYTILGNCKTQKSFFYLQGRLSVHKVISGTQTVAFALAQPRPSFFPIYRPMSLLLPGFPFISVQICSLQLSPELQTPAPGFTAFITCLYFFLQLLFHRIPLLIAFISDPAQLCRSREQTGFCSVYSICFL